MSARSYAAKTTPNTAQNFNNQRTYQTGSNFMNTYPMYVPATSSGYSPGAMYTHNSMATTCSPMYNIPNTRYNTSNVFTPMTAAHCDNAYVHRHATGYDYNHATRTDLRYPQTNWEFSQIPGYSMAANGVPTLMGAMNNVGTGALIGAGTGATLAAGYDVSRYMMRGT